jgi:hypothetical protein
LTKKTQFFSLAMLFTFTLILSLAITRNEAAASASDSQFFAKLDSYNEISAPTTDAATGVAISMPSGIASFSTNGDVMFYKIKANGVYNIMGARLQDSENGTGGEVVATLISARNSTASPQNLFTEGIVSSAITSKDLTGPLQGKSIIDLLDLIEKGRIYVNLYSTGNPDGEIGGRVILQ